MNSPKKSRSFSLWLWALAFIGCAACCSFPFIAADLGSATLIAWASHAEIVALVIFVVAVGLTAL